MQQNWWITRFIITMWNQDDESRNLEDLQAYWKEIQRKRHNTEVNCQPHYIRTLEQTTTISVLQFLLDYQKERSTWIDGNSSISFCEGCYQPTTITTTQLIWVQIRHWTISFISSYSNMTKKDDSKRPIWWNEWLFYDSHATASTIFSSCTGQIPVGDIVDEDGFQCSSFQELWKQGTTTTNEAGSIKRDCQGN